MYGSYRLRKSANLEPQSGSIVTEEGDLAYNHATHQLEVSNGTSAESVTTSSNTQVLSNKTLDGGTSIITNLTNASIAAGAAIAYSKLNLSNGIVNADINTSAAIAYSKLSLTNSVVNADIGAAAAISLSKLAPLTASKVLQSDGSGIISPSSVTSTELGYVSGATSNIQNQINSISLGSFSYAHEIYLDSVNGLDTNPGGTSTPFKTIGAALASFSDEDTNPRVFILAPGDYSAGSPYTWRRNISIVGLGGLGGIDTPSVGGTVQLTNVGVLNLTDSLATTHTQKMFFRNIRCDINFNISGSTDAFNLSFENTSHNKFHILGNNSFVEMHGVVNEGEPFLSGNRVELTDVSSRIMSCQFNNSHLGCLLINSVNFNSNCVMRGNSVNGPIVIGQTGSNATTLETDRSSVYDVSVTIGSLCNIAFPDEEVVSTSASTYNVTTETVIRCNTSGGPITVNLPSVAHYSGKFLYVKRNNDVSFAVTISPAAGEHIDDATSKVISGAYQCIGLAPDPAFGQWLIISSV